jgi:hypothetical protein
MAGLTYEFNAAYLKVLWRTPDDSFQEGYLIALIIGVNPLVVASTMAGGHLLVGLLEGWLG